MYRSFLASLFCLITTYYNQNTEKVHCHSQRTFPKHFHKQQYFSADQSPKLMPTIFASLMMLDLGSTILSLPATSLSGTLTISRFL